MRRWKRIANGLVFRKGDVLVLACDDQTICVPKMLRISDGYEAYAGVHYMVEIDEDGNTIRTYEKGDKLDEGTLVGGNMDKKKIMERLNVLELKILKYTEKEIRREIKELKEMLEKEDEPKKEIYDPSKYYCFKKSNGSSEVKGMLWKNSCALDTCSWITIGPKKPIYGEETFVSAQVALDYFEKIIKNDPNWSLHVFTRLNDALDFIKT